MSENQEQLSSILSSIPQSAPLFLFPLRLETYFREQNEQNQLCVRIIPDEILLHYHREALSKDEYKDGKFFWFQWFVASGNDSREKEAWKILCSKYPVHRAAWICKVLKPKKLDDFRANGPLFNKRPFHKLIKIEDCCKEINNQLSQIQSKTTREQLTTDIPIQLKTIDDLLQASPEVIVDYLHDLIVNTVAPLKQHPYFSTVSEIDHILEKIKDKRITLDKMVAICAEENKDFLSDYKIDNSPNSDFTFPTTDLFPKKFFFIGEVADKKNSIIYASSNEVSEDIKISFDTNQQYKIDAHGNFEFDKSIKWMVDYEEAVEKGMAITVNIEPTVKKFNYIYVLGIKESQPNDFEKLFNGHNYIASSIQYLKKYTPTNIIDEKKAESQEEELIDKRYEIEVNDSYTKQDNNEAHALSELFASCKDDIYKNCLGRIANYNLKQDTETAKAYGILWDTLKETVKPKLDKQGSFIKKEINLFNNFINFLDIFIKNNLRASGNIPSIRVDDVPYGILPVSDFMKLRDSISSSEIENRESLLALLNDLIALANKWKDLRKSNVITSENLINKNDEKPESRFLQMAGQTPYSVSFNQRKAIESPLIEKNKPSKIYVDNNPFYSPKPPKNFFRKILTAILNVLRKIFNIIKRAIPLLDDYSILNKLITNDNFAAEPIADAVNETNIKEISFDEKTKLIELLEKEFEPEAAGHYVVEFLDLFTYRLDAWFNGILDYIRKSSSLDTPYLGAYGWVFDLEKKDETKTEKDGAHFILAPSIQHALSAAVLRSAHIKSINDGENFCVNLSSMRVRQALRLIDGIKNGMSMSVVLGSDLERYLHDANNLDGTIELDQYIYPLRERLKQTIKIETGNKEAQSYLMQVINGEQLLSTIIENWKWEGSLHNWLEKNFDSLEWSTALNDIDDKAKQAFFRIIERLMDSYDALNDLLLSESVHRLIMGDKASFYAIGNFIATGKGNISDLEILKFPSEKVVIAHKAGIILPQAEKEPIKALSIADPAVNSWIESLFGTANIGFTIKVDGKTEQKCTLNDLGISGAEYLYLSAYPQTFTNYLEVRWRIKNNCFGETITIDQDSANTQLSLSEDALRIETLRKILKAGQGMNATDLAMELKEELQDGECIAPNDLENRYNNIKKIAQDLLTNIDKWLSNNEGKNDYDEEALKAAYELFCRCIELGMINTHIDYNAKKISSVEGRKILRQNMEDAQENLKTRIESANSEADKSSAIQTLTLKNVKVFPRFKLNSEKIEPNTEKALDEINGVISKTEKAIEKGISQFTNVNPDSFEEWEDEIAEVRRGMKEIHNLSLFQTALNSDIGTASILQKVSSSFEQKNKWMGLEVQEEADLCDADSLLLYNKDAYKEKGYNSGFIFDSWIEYIPYKKHNAGLVFHCDRPDNEAPQAILYTIYPNVSPLPTDKWNLDTLKDILATTRFMMMNRAVEPDAIYENMELSRIFPLIRTKNK